MLYKIFYWDYVNEEMAYDDQDEGFFLDILGLDSADSPTFVTVKLSGLTDDYIPYHVNDATGLANGPTKTNVDSAISLKHTAGTDTALGTLGTKNPPIDADKLPYRDSTASDALVTSTWTQIKAFLKTYLDTIYNLYVHPNHSGDVTSVADGATTIAAKAVHVSMLADGTDGELITWDSDGVAAVVAAGTATHVLTSNGAGAAPTFQAPTGGAGDVATDTIWDAKGDLAVGTGADTAAILTVGANGKYLKAASGEATGLLWDTPAGAGDVVAPATNSADYVPQWDGANSKTLKNGLAVGTGNNNLVQLNGSAQLPAIDGSLLTGISGGVSDTDFKKHFLL